MKSKIHSNKKVAAVLLGAGAIAITGIAFGSWIISQPPVSGEIGNITLEVGSVKDSTLKIENLNFVDEETGKIVFDAKSGDTEPPIVSNGNDSLGGEKLDIQITFDVLNALKSGGSSPADNFGGVNLKLTSDHLDELASAVSSNFIVSPVSLAGKGTDIGAPSGIPSSGQTASDGLISCDFTGSDTTLKVTATISFAWGSYFNNLNPSLFDPASEAYSTVGLLSSYETALNSLSALNNATFTLTVTPIDNSFSQA